MSLETLREYKCLNCEFVTEYRDEMMQHQFEKHQRFFDPDKNRPETVSQLGHVNWHVKILNHGNLVWETVSTRLDPDQEKLPTGNLTGDSLMPFGKHKGTRMRDVPYKYLHWIYTASEKKPYNRGVFTYIKNNIKELRFENLDLVWEPKATKGKN